MDTDEFTQKIKGIFHKAVDSTKMALDKAGNKVQDFSDKSVVRLEKHKLETSLEETYTELGKKVAELLKEGATISTSEENQNILLEFAKKVSDLQNQIQEKEELLKKE